MIDITGVAQRVQAKVSEAQARARGFEWYRYDTWSNLAHLRPLFGPHLDSVIEAAQKEGVLDLGCGDGQLSFLFEALGCSVTAVDHPATNHNGMQGVHTLARELESKVDIRELDIDSQFVLPQSMYGLAIFLGALYHLKNPFYALEHSARHARYCLLSTRVARCYPDGTPMPAGEPVAYLLDEDELNQDNSNFWIFSWPALERMVKRARWEILASRSIGDTAGSRPTGLEHDERMFFLLKSHHGLAHLELGDGWWETTPDGWRWTKQRFTASGVGDRFVLDVFVPDELLKDGPLTLSGRFGEARIEPAIFSHSGNHRVSRQLPLGDTIRELEFRLDRAVHEAGPAGRELGIVVASLEFE